MTAPVPECELVQGQKTTEYFGDLRLLVHESWWPFFSSPNVVAELEDITTKLMKREAAGEVIYPTRKNMLRVFSLTSLYDAVAVIVGQDPYANGHATGIAFSGGTKPGVVPQSLKNIVKEVQRCYPKRTIPDLKDPSLEGWSKQGVILINQCLSVTEHQEGGHKGLWSGFILEFIGTVVNHNSQIPWLLWGSVAKRVCENTIKKRGGTNVLTCGHPSPKSVAYWQNNGHFLQVDQILLENGYDEVKWWRFNDQCEDVEE